MKIVIDIPTKEYSNTIKGRWEGNPLANYIENGTPLPEGHTEFVDRQIIADYVHSHIQEINTGYGDLNQHTNRILRMIEDYIEKAPTIVESDKAESEGDEKW